MDLQSILLVVVFVVGFTGIVLEHNLKVNKSWIALATGSVMWMIASYGRTPEALHGSIMHSSAEIFELIIFLIGAMTLVEMMAHFRFFSWIEAKLLERDISNVTLFWLLGLITFVASALLDNLTSTLVMIQIGRHLYIRKVNFNIYVINVVIAANAGGAMSPVGDVTTIMLWLAGKFTAWDILIKGALPSLAAWVIPQTMLTSKIMVEERSGREKKEILPLQWQIIIMGLTTFGLAVVVNILHLPPFFGILFGLGIVAIVIDLKLKRGKLKKEEGHIVNIIKTIDMATIKFFVGILLAVDALQFHGILAQVATFIFGENPGAHPTAIIIGHTALGIFSSILDNVPLTAAVIKMLPEGIDSIYWILLAITAGTGGSILIVGSAAGVAAMGQVKSLSFMEYLKKGSLPALMGYISAVVVWYVLFML